MVQWESRLELGVPELDAQHRELFARLAGFDAALAEGDVREVARTFAFLRDYALVHFEAEERIMRAAAYPRLEEHRGLHRAFVERLGTLTRDHEADGPTWLLRLRTRNWIIVWLVEHVGVEDAALGRHLLARTG